MKKQLCVSAFVVALVLAFLLGSVAGRDALLNFVGVHPQEQSVPEDQPSELGDWSHLEVHEAVERCHRAGQLVHLLDQGDFVCGDKELIESIKAAEKADEGGSDVNQ